MSDKRRIRIYSGGGALPICTAASLDMARRMFNECAAPVYTHDSTRYDISAIDAHEIRSRTSGWQKDTALIIFSGGAVTQFKQALQDDGLYALKDYVTSGGVYLGLCAGAYFGAQDIDFTGHDWQTRQPYKRQGEGLGFFNGLARGSLRKIAPLYDGTSATCCATPVTLEGLYPTRDLPPQASVFYGGGPEFLLPEATPLSDSRIISRYILKDGSKRIAGLSCPVGEDSGEALLLSWHADMNAAFLKSRKQHHFQDPGHQRQCIAYDMDKYNNEKNLAVTWLGKHLKRRLAR